MTCTSFSFIDAAFTAVDGSLLADLPTYAAGDLLLAGWRTFSSTDPPSGWSTQLATETDDSTRTGFHMSFRIADGSEGSTLTLPTGSDSNPAVVACWRPSADISGATWRTVIQILSAPFYGGDYMSGSSVSSVASEFAEHWPGSDQFAASVLLDPAAGVEIDTFGFGFLAGTLPDYHWNHETERAQSLGLAGWNALVADGLADSTSGSPAPSLSVDETHTGIYSGWLTFICAGVIPPPAPAVPSDIDDCFYDQLGVLIEEEC